MAELRDDVVEQAIREFGRRRVYYVMANGLDAMLNTLRTLGLDIAGRVRAEAVAERDAIIEVIQQYLPEALPFNTLPEIVGGIARQRDFQHEMKDHLAEVARRLTDERGRVVAAAVADERRRAAQVIINNADTVHPVEAQRLADLVAAGSVPVATLPDERAHSVRCRLFDRCTRADCPCWCHIGPVATPSPGVGECPTCKSQDRGFVGEYIAPGPSGQPVDRTCEDEWHQVDASCGPVPTPTEPSRAEPDAMLAYSVEQITEWELRRCGTGMAGLGLREQRALLADARATRRMIVELRDEVAVLRSAARLVSAGQASGDREAFDRRSGEGEAGAELLGHRLTVGEVTPGHPTHIGAGYNCCCGECLCRRSVPTGQEASDGAQ